MLFETAAGFALFKVLQEGKLKEATDLWQDFSSLDSAQSVRKSCCYRTTRTEAVWPGAEQMVDHGMCRSSSSRLSTSLRTPPRHLRPQQLC